MGGDDTTPRLAFYVATLLTTLALTAPCADAEETWLAVVGTLRTPIAPIGGETTGTIITADGVNWELDFAKNDTLSRTAQQISGRQVMVQGKLEHRQAVEIKERLVVTVTALQQTDQTSLPGLSTFGFRTTVGRDNTKFHVSPTKYETIFDIHSPFGIDVATIERLRSGWPSRVIVRIHLQGLESFQAKCNDLTIQWSVSSSDGDSARVSLRREKIETSVSKGDPYYSPVRIHGGKVPVKDGYFEVPLPEKLFEENPLKIQLRWIDFYRN